MKATEFIKRLQEAVDANGDKEVVIAANRHSYADAKVISRDDQITIALFDKVAE